MRGKRIIGGVLAAVAVLAVLAAAWFSGQKAPAGPEATAAGAWMGSGIPGTPVPTAAARTPAGVPTAAAPGTCAPTATARPTAPAPTSAAPMAPQTPGPTAAPTAPPQTPAPTPAPDAGGAPGGGVCTLSVDCLVLLDRLEELEEEVRSLVPEDGMLLGPVEVAFQEGESVFDLLARAARENGLHLEFTKTALYNSAYIEGIGNFYEMDCGPLSGWVYTVNGELQSVGSSQCLLRDGDEVKWVYTCDLGGNAGYGKEGEE